MISTEKKNLWNKHPRKGYVKPWTKSKTPLGYLASATVLCTEATDRNLSNEEEGLLARRKREIDGASLTKYGLQLEADADCVRIYADELFDAFVTWCIKDEIQTVKGHLALGMDFA